MQLEIELTSLSRIPTRAPAEAEAIERGWPS